MSEQRAPSAVEIETRQTAFSAAVDLQLLMARIATNLPPSIVLSDVLFNLSEALSSLSRLAGKDNRAALDKGLARIAAEEAGGASAGAGEGVDRG